VLELDSRSLLSTVRDPARSARERMLAFNLMVDLRSGWWGDGPNLREFAVVVAMRLAEQRRKKNLAADFIDAESAADDALMELLNLKNVIRGRPAAWLVGVIKNKVKEGVRRETHTIAAPSLDDPDCHIPHPSVPFDHDRRHIERAGNWQFGRHLIRTLKRMPPKRRSVARLVLRILLGYHIHGQSRIGFRQVAKQLGMTEAAARKHWERARGDIATSIQANYQYLLR